MGPGHRVPDRGADDPDVLALFGQLPDPQAREDLTKRFLPLAAHLAGRFAGKGEAREDLEQVAALGLVHAIDRFDPGRGVLFSTFAAVTIVGELRRHFRDKGWAIRVPRALQEAALLVNRSLGPLWQELGRSPTIAEIARRTDLSEEAVIEAMEAVQAYSTASLDLPVGEGDSTSAGDLVGEVDPGFDASDEWLGIEPALAALPARERRILYLRFFEDKTQSEIAREVGISQMHVSRLLAQSLAKIREATAPAVDHPGSP
jgi:RNA polymerase sigma-B factor